jgi:hypothetical protein
MVFLFDATDPVVLHGPVQPRQFHSWLQFLHQMLETRQQRRIDYPSLCIWRNQQCPDAISMVALVLHTQLDNYAVRFQEVMRADYHATC